MRRAGRLRRDDGAVAVVVALCVAFVAVPMLALTLDAGMLMSVRGGAQNAAEQAAMAAAWASCNGRDPATAATTAATRNGYTVGTAVGGGVVASVTPVNRGGGSWGVSITLDVDYDFAPIFGTESAQVFARAAASCQSQTVQGPSIHAHSSTCNDTIQWSGNEFTVSGDVHTNGELKVSGNQITHTGAATYGTTLQVSGNQITWRTPAGTATSPTRVAARPWPLWFNINDFDTGGVYASRADYVSASGTTTINNSWLSSRGYLNGSGVITPKIYYTDGKIDLSGNVMTGSATFVARDEITISGNTHRFTPHFMDLAAFSNAGSSCGHNAVKLSGNFIDLEGIVFAPNAEVQLSGNYVEIDGTVVSNQIKFSGNQKVVRTGRGSTIQSNPTVGLDAW